MTPTDKNEADKIRETEDGTRSDDARQMAMIANISDVIAIISRDGIIRYKSPNIEKWFGWKPSEILGAMAWNNIHPEDLEKARNVFAELLSEASATRTAECRYRCKNGDYKWIEYTATNLIHDPCIGGVLLNYHDISKRKRADEELRQEKDFTDAIFNSAPGILYVYNDQGRLVRWNKQHETLTGYSARELAQMTLLAWYKDDEKSQATIVEGLKRTVETGFGDAYAYLQRKDGVKIPMYLTASPLTVAGKSYFVGIGLDITERKRTEEEKEKLQSQLVQAQKMESVGRLAGGVAHDFNNMLGVILGHVELALDHAPAGSPLCDHLVEIRKAAERSSDLTRQLLAFARKQTISPKVINLNETVAGMLKMLQRLIGEDIHLIWRPGADLWLVKMDTSQIDQLLANLTVNARDAIRGVGQITIESTNITFGGAHAQPQGDCLPGDYVALSVSDTGCGMDSETRSHLFEPFFTTKNVGEGTGLGLATVYGIVKQNGGMIHVSSEPGRGSTFKLFLPRCSSRQETGNSEPGKQASHGTETVLLVEDEEQILNLGCRILRQQGYNVLAASHPDQALELARNRKEPIHLLVTDVIMPGMNGRELWDRVSALTPGMRCLFMSGYTADVIAHQGVLENDVEFLPKPFSAHALATKVRAVLDSPQSVF